MENNNFKTKLGEWGKKTYSFIDDLFYIIDLYTRSYNTFFIWTIGTLILFGTIYKPLFFLLLLTATHKAISSPQWAGQLRRNK